MIQGVIFVLCVLLFRRGIVGELARIFRLKGVLIRHSSAT